MDLLVEPEVEKYNYFEGNCTRSKSNDQLRNHLILIFKYILVPYLKQTRLALIFYSFSLLVFVFVFNCFTLTGGIVLFNLFIIFL
uniref:Uncharacterized protein n=1 Tax=Heterorhabditis bacteriophora TaxID=37862 RepID=A0A1I7WEB2_HETBA